MLDGTASVSGELPADACVGPVTDVNVVVQATTPRADLTAVEVTAPNGSTVLLKGGAMQSQGAGIWVVFDDEAASSIDQAAPVGQAPFNLLEWARPAEPLALFDGLPGAGTWTVTARSLGAANGVVDLHLAMIDVVCADVATDVASGPLAVPQGVLRTSTITVPAERCAGPVEDVDVQVVMANRGNDDVTLLVEHDGVRVALKGLGGSTLPGIRGVFDDEAADPFMTRPGLMAFDPYRARGAFRPAAPLSALDGLVAEGAWTLEVTSTTPAELQVWSLAITCGAGPGGPSDDRVVVLAGPSRVETAVEVSQDRHAAGSADVAVLARADAFADALAGAPLAVAVGGPLLLTQPDSLHPATAAELQRVLDPGGTVVLLGGVAALADEVADAVAALGFAVERAAGPSRVETAVAIAEQVEAHAGAPASVLLATGETFPHALVAGAAAPQLDGVLLLTSGAAAHPATQGWLADHPGIVRYAVGAPARAAHPEAQGVGDDSAAGTAVAVADLLGADPTVVGIASSEVFADALGGGAHIGAAGGPLLLTGPDDLADEAAAWLTDHAATVDTAYVYGGDAAISPAVRAAVASAIAG